MTAEIHGPFTRTHEASGEPLSSRTPRVSDHALTPALRARTCRWLEKIFARVNNWGIKDAAGVIVRYWWANPSFGDYGGQRTSHRHRHRLRAVELFGRGGVHGRMGPDCRERGCRSLGAILRSDRCAPRSCGTYASATCT